MGCTLNTDSRIEEFFVGSTKILTHNTATHELVYHQLPVNHIKVYEAVKNLGELCTDNSLGYFSTDELARAAAQGKAEWGGNGIVRIYDAIEIVNRGHRSVYILKHADPADVDNQKAAADEELRRKTIASLTDEQLRVLGLKEA